MWNLILLVLNDPAKLEDLLEAWEAVGIRGATVLESSGLAQYRGYLRDDAPLFPSIGSLFQREATNHRTIFAIVDEKIHIPTLVAKTEAVIGDLNQPYTGIFAVTPLSFVKGTDKTHTKA